MKKGGSGRGNPAPLIPSPLPPPRVLADTAARGTWNTRHEPPPPLPPHAHAEPAPRARARPVHPRACALPRPCPCVGRYGPGGGVGEIGGEKKTARGTQPGERRVHSGSWGFVGGRATEF